MSCVDTTYQRPEAPPRSQSLQAQEKMTFSGQAQAIRAEALYRSNHHLIRRALQWSLIVSRLGGLLRQMSWMPVWSWRTLWNLYLPRTILYLYQISVGARLPQRPT